MQIKRVEDIEKLIVGVYTDLGEAYIFFGNQLLECLIEIWWY